MSFILSATEQLAKYMHKGIIVVLESSTYPGTTREILLPMLGDANGLTVGEDWFLAFSRSVWILAVRISPHSTLPKWWAVSRLPAQKSPQLGTVAPSSTSTCIIGGSG